VLATTRYGRCIMAVCSHACKELAVEQPPMRASA
jgi:hypothetical protein